MRAVKEALNIPVVSNGNVRTFEDVRANLEYTKADGAMVGETLLGNPTFVFPVQCVLGGRTEAEDGQVVFRKGCTRSRTHLPCIFGYL